MEWIVQPCPWADEKHIVTKGNDALSKTDGDEYESEVMEFLIEAEAVEVAKILNKIIRW